MVIVDSEDVDFGIKIVLENSKNFEKLVEKWIASTPEEEEKKGQPALAARYVRTIRKG